MKFRCSEQDALNLANTNFLRRIEELDVEFIHLDDEGNAIGENSSFFIFVMMIWEIINSYVEVRNTK